MQNVNVVEATLNVTYGGLSFEDEDTPDDYGPHAHVEADVVPVEEQVRVAEPQVVTVPLLPDKLTVQFENQTLDDIAARVADQLATRSRRRRTRIGGLLVACAAVWFGSTQVFAPPQEIPSFLMAVLDGQTQGEDPVPYRDSDLTFAVTELSARFTQSTRNTHVTGAKLHRDVPADTYLLKEINNRLDLAAPLAMRPFLRKTQPHLPVASEKPPRVAQGHIRAERYLVATAAQPEPPERAVLRFFRLNAPQAFEAGGFNGLSANAPSAPLSFPPSAAGSGPFSGL